MYSVFTPCVATCNASASISRLGFEPHTLRRTPYMLPHSVPHTILWASAQVPAVAYEPDSRTAEGEGAA